MSKEKEHEHTPKRWVGCEIEVDYFGEDRKIGKKERKKASEKDRSKYKKTDRSKPSKNITLSAEDHDKLLRGRVLSITPQGILVAHENDQYVCSLRGVLKKEKSQFKNLVVVGDFVLFEKGADNEGLIAKVEARKSILSRADNLSRRKEQLIAANIDQVLITVSVVEPVLKPFLVDRYIIATRKGNMRPIIIINKIDLIENNDDPLIQEALELYNDFIEAYRIAGIPVISVSAGTGQGMDELKETMRDKASVFSGQSGVGKSSLINAVTGLDLKTGPIVDKTNKGTHTTTTANLVALPFGGWCIDTPGIKSFGVWDLKKDEIESYFTEIHEAGKTCKYPNCTHTQENDCAVKNAVESKKISMLRYMSYQYLVQSESREHVRR